MLEYKFAMYAIAEIQGKQYKVEEGRYLDVDLLNQKAGSILDIDKVLLVSDSNKSVKVGKPYIEGASVSVEVQKSIKDNKIIVFKQRPKKGTRRKQGHRQQYSRILVKKIKES